LDSAGSPSDGLEEGGEEGRPMAPSNPDGDAPSSTLSKLSEPRADNLGPQYSEAADDGAASEKQREGSMLYSVAEAHFQDGALEEALSTIKDALAIFRAINDSRSLADSLRLKMHASRALAEQEHNNGNGGREEKLLLDAEAAMREELNKFRACGDKRGEACMLLAVAQALSALGGFPKRTEAQECLQDARDLSWKIKDVKLEASIVYEYASLMHLCHRYKQAIKAAREAQKLFSSVGDVKNEAFSWCLLGDAQIVNGKAEDGFLSKRKAHDIFRRIGDKKMEGTVLMSFAEWYINERDEYSAGVSRAQDACAIFKELGEQKMELKANRCVINGLLRQKEHATALKVAKAGFDLAKEFGEEQEILTARQQLSTVQLESGEIEEAMCTAQDMVFASKGMEDKRLYAQALLQVGMAYDTNRDYHKAEEKAREASLVYKGMRRYEADYFSIIQQTGRIHIKKEEYDLALDCMELAREVAQEVEDLHLEGVAMLGISGCWFGMENLEKAKSAATIARELFQEEGYQRGEARVIKLALSDYFMEEKEYNSAQRITREGLKLVEDIGDIRMCCQMKQRLADIYMASSMAKEAAAEAMEALKLARMEEDKRSTCVVLLSVISANFHIMTTEIPQESRGGKAFDQSAEKLARFAKECLSHAVKCRDTELEALANLWVARVHLLQGKLQEALQAALSSTELAKECQEEPTELEGQLIVGAAQMELGEKDQAEKTLRKVFRSAYEIEHQHVAEEAAKMLEELLLPEGEKLALKLQPLMEAADEESKAAAKPTGTVAEVFHAPDIKRVRNFIDLLVKQINGGSTDSDYSEDTPIMDSGIDSLTTVELRTQLQEEFRVNLPSSVFFSHPTTTALARCIVDECTAKKIKWRS